MEQRASNHSRSIIGIALLTLILMAAIGSLSNQMLARFYHVGASFMVAQNTLEAMGFLVAAFSAGFVEEFVFRGYIQQQFKAAFKNTLLASALQILLFTEGHLYQGWMRAIPVLVIGTLLTLVVLWRKSLVPGMLAHGAWRRPCCFFILC
jgi:membrane protease YdiL (CAAX protease family)